MSKPGQARPQQQTLEPDVEDPLGLPQGPSTRSPKERSSSTTGRQKTRRACRPSRSRGLCGTSRPAQRAQPSQNTGLWQEADVCEGLSLQSASSSSPRGLAWDLSRPHRSPCKRQVLFCRRPRRVFLIASLSAKATADVAETGALKKTRFGLTKRAAARRASRRPLTELPPTERAGAHGACCRPRAIRHPRSELPPPERVGARRASCHPRSEPAPTEQAAALRASR